MLDPTESQAGRLARAGAFAHGWAQSPLDLGERMSRPRQDEDRVTIMAVARRAGVSAMTVSNVVNDTGRASEATRERVRAAIAELGYTPNQAARRLVGSAVACVGLIYPGARSIFIDAALAAVTEVAAQEGIQLWLRTALNATPEATVTIAGALIRAGAQALLLLPPYAEILGETPHRLGHRRPGGRHRHGPGAAGHDHHPHRQPWRGARHHREPHRQRPPADRGRRRPAASFR